jgi:hypothetical protein
MHLIGDCKVHNLRSKPTDGEKAYMFYVLVPGPICKMFFLFMNKMDITKQEIWSDKSTPSSPLKWIEHLRNINAESSIQRELVNFAKQRQSNLRRIGLLKLGQPK